MGSKVFLGSREREQTASDRLASRKLSNIDLIWTRKLFLTEDVALTLP